MIDTLSREKSRNLSYRKFLQFYQKKIGRFLGKKNTSHIQVMQMIKPEIVRTNKFKPMMTTKITIQFLYHSIIYEYEILLSFFIR